MIGEGRLRSNGRWKNILEISNLGVLDYTGGLGVEAT